MSHTSVRVCIFVFRFSQTLERGVRVCFFLTPKPDKRNTPEFILTAKVHVRPTQTFFLHTGCACLFGSGFVSFRYSTPGSPAVCIWMAPPHSSRRSRCSRHVLQTQARFGVGLRFASQRHFPGWVSLWAPGSAPRSCGVATSLGSGAWQHVAVSGHPTLGHHTWASGSILGRACLPPPPPPPRCTFRKFALSTRPPAFFSHFF